MLDIFGDEESIVGNRIRVGKVAEIIPGASVVVSAHCKDVAVFNVGGAFHAIDDLCPHMGASLSSGYLEGDIVTCPWHYWRFRVTDGSWADNPRVRTGCYAAIVEGDEVFVDIGE